MNEEDTSPDRLRALEEENSDLRCQLNEKQVVDEDMYAYRIFVEARKKADCLGNERRGDTRDFRYLQL